MRLDDGVALRVERYCIDVGPVAGVVGPPRWVECASLGVEDVPSHQERLVLAGMALRLGIRRQLS